MRLMDTHLSNIIRKEHSDGKSIHLYGTGEYWVAFEQSAYLLCQLFAKNEISVITHATYPFPVVMASISDLDLCTYSKQHIFKRDEPDYKELVAAEIPAKQYQIWHRKEVQEFL